VVAAHKLTKVRRRATEEVRKAYADFETNHATLDLVRTRLLPAQQQRRAQTEAAYQTGQTDITTLTLADQDFQAARTKLIDLQRKTASALIRLERSVGGPGVADGLVTRRAASGPASAPSTRPVVPTSAANPNR
jgi:outer membrane protein TolC